VWVEVQVLAGQNRAASYQIQAGGCRVNGGYGLLGTGRPLDGELRLLNRGRGRQLGRLPRQRLQALVGSHE
jgi:hypothetical protein